MGFELETGAGTSVASRGGISIFVGSGSKNCEKVWDTNEIGPQSDGERELSFRFNFLSIGKLA